MKGTTNGTITDMNGNCTYLNSAGKPILITGTGRHWGPAFNGRDIENYDYSTIAYSPVKNNFKDAYNLGFNSNTNVSVSGSSEKTSFYTSLSYKYASGTLPSNSFDRTSKWKRQKFPGEPYLPDFRHMGSGGEKQTGVIR